MSHQTITLFTFIAVAIGVAALCKLLADLVFKHHERINERFKEEFRDDMRDRAKQSALFKDLQQLAADTTLPEPTAWRKFQAHLEQSGLGVTADQVLMISVAAGMAAALIVHFFVGLLLTACAFVVVAIVPIVFVEMKRNARMSGLCKRLPEAFDMMARALRAGQTISAAFQMIANDFRGPIAEEFAYCYEQQHLGIAPEVALRDLARRTAVMEMQIFAVALIVQRRAGGNLAELLIKLSTMMRKRAQLRAKIRSLTSEGRLQAVLLTALPPVAFVAMLFVDRDYAGILLDHRNLLYVAGGLQIVGMLLIRRITTRAF